MGTFERDRENTEQCKHSHALSNSFPIGSIEEYNFV